MSKLRALLTAVMTVAALLGVPLHAGPARAVPCGAGCSVGPRYQLIEVHKHTQATLYALGEIGSCKNAGGTCTISKVATRTTQIGVSLGISKGAVAGTLDYSVSFTSSSGVSCTSPKLKRGQVYRAYVRGKYSTYKVRKTYAGHTWTSGVLYARQPYKMSITCRVYNS